MNQEMLLEIDSSDSKQVRSQVSRSFRSIRSARVRSVFCEFIRSYFQTQGYGRRKTNSFIGISVLDRETLELARAFGDQIEIRGIFLLIVERDVPVSLAAETISSISMLGFVSAADDVMQVLGDRTKAGFFLSI